MPTIHVAASRRPEIESLVRRLPGILAGTDADHAGIGHGFRMRVSFAFFSLVKEAYIVKSRGGTDECGITWPKLSAKYLAYQRPTTGGKPPRAGGRAPGGRDGFMTKAQLEQWRRDYARSLAWLAASVPLAEAKQQAAKIAWARAKRAGVRTKLEVFGNRQVEILRDRGILFNSLSPGMLAEQGADAQYQAPDGQVINDGPGWMLCGTNVEYAKYHQNGKRPLWPKDGKLPQLWVAEIAEVAASGLDEIGTLIARGGF